MGEGSEYVRKLIHAYITPYGVMLCKLYLSFSSIVWDLVAELIKNPCDGGLDYELDAIIEYAHLRCSSPADCDAPFSIKLEFSSASAGSFEGAVFENCEGGD